VFDGLAVQTADREEPRVKEKRKKQEEEEEQEENKKRGEKMRH